MNLASDFKYRSWSSAVISKCPLFGTRICLISVPVAIAFADEPTSARECLAAHASLLLVVRDAAASF
jgi:hypothetical protein